MEGEKQPAKTKSFSIILWKEIGECSNTLPDQRNASARETQARPYTAGSSSLLGHKQGVSHIAEAFTLMTCLL